MQAFKQLEKSPPVARMRTEKHADRKVRPSIQRRQARTLKMKQRGFANVLTLFAVAGAVALVGAVLTLHARVLHDEAEIASIKAVMNAGVTKGAVHVCKQVRDTKLWACRKVEVQDGQ